MIIYSKSSGYTNAAYGKIETPVKMIIEHESDQLTKKGGIADWLFNIEKSNKFGETIIVQNGFDTFKATAEGSGAENDTIAESTKKFIEHIQFMKEFVITAEMIEDAVGGLATDAKRRAEAFTRAYYKTMHKICETALANATAETQTFAGTTLDLTTADSMPLFHQYHEWGCAQGLNGYQSNYYYGDIVSQGTGDDRKLSSGVFEETLSELCVKFRSMKDESGEPLGYSPDTIILPGNRGKLETMVKKVCGSDGALGNGYNDINLHYGNWNIVVLPGWVAEDDRLMIMSSEANKNLCGNMFFNRVPLSVSNWVDNHTGNYHWAGRCRFGVGFGTYKHIMLAVDSESEIENADPIA